MSSYTLTTLWHERQRFLPAVLAVAFSALLIAVQTGLLLGMFTFASLPVDHSAAHVWVGGRGVQSVELGRPTPESYLCRLAAQPEVERCEPVLQGFAEWLKPGGGAELCVVVGSRLGAESLGAVRELTPELRARLAEPGSVVVDESDLGLLGVRGVGDVAAVSERRVRVVGVVRGLRGLAGAYVFCSLRTARALLEMRPGQAVFLLARCRDGADARAVAARVGAAAALSAFTSEELSRRSRLRWLSETRAGLVLGLAAALGLVVGAAVTSQTLYAATLASAREYALLWALGIPRRRVAAEVLAQAFWVGAAGTLLALPAAAALTWLIDRLGACVLLPAWLLAATAAVTLAMALLSGVVALRVLRLLGPARLLR
jgi:putative ABC transport system permease protein